MPSFARRCAYGLHATVEPASQFGVGHRTQQGNFLGRPRIPNHPRSRRDAEQEAVSKRGRRAASDASGDNRVRCRAQQLLFLDRPSLPSGGSGIRNVKPNAPQGDRSDGAI
jgi:hypothetical protein